MLSNDHNAVIMSLLVVRFFEAFSVPNIFLMNLHEVGFLIIPVYR